MFGMGKKKLIETFLEDKSKAVIHIYGSSIIIDGTPVKELEMVKGMYGEFIVKLSEGKHTVHATYNTTTSSNKNIKAKNIQNEIEVKSGVVYTLGMYEYSKKFMEENKDNPKMEHVLYQSLTGHYKEFAIICFIEKKSL